MMQLTAGDSELTIDLVNGGRIASLVASGIELLHTEDTDNPLAWGSYPMVPFAGRVRNGQFDFDGQSYQLPTNERPHALHGYGFTSSWAEVDENTIRWELADPWPFPATVEQRFDLAETHLELKLSVTAAARQPVHLGWHPWWRQETPAGTLELDFPAESMYVRGSDGMPTGELIAPHGGPYDDCFTGLTGDPVLRWGDFELQLRSSVGYWIVYDEPEHATCVEPQSGPPNQFNPTPGVASPLILEAGETFEATFDLDWA